MKKQDKLDPICGMKGHIKAHGSYFCSQNCIKEYERHNRMKHCISCDIKGGHRPWYKERLYIVSIATAIIILITSFEYRVFPNKKFLCGCFETVSIFIVIAIIDKTT